MATRIVFVGGTHIEVPTPIQNLVWLFEESGRSVSFAPAGDSSMRYFINREMVLYLETVSATGEKPFWVLSNPHGRAKADLSGFSGAPPGRRTPDA